MMKPILGGFGVAQKFVLKQVGRNNAGPCIRGSFNQPFTRLARLYTTDSYPKTFTEKLSIRSLYRMSGIGINSENLSCPLPPELEHASYDEKSEFYNVVDYALISVIHPLMVDRDSLPNVCYVPTVTKPQDVERALNTQFGGRGFCVVDRKMMDELRRKETCYGFPFGKSVVYLGLKKHVPLERNQAVMYFTEKGFGRKINPNYEFSCNDVSIVEPLNDGAPLLVTDKIEFHDTKTNIFPNSTNVQHRASTNVKLYERGIFSTLKTEWEHPLLPCKKGGAGIHHLVVQQPDHLRESVELMHFHPTGRVLRAEHINMYSVFVTKDPQGNICFTLMKRGDVQIFGPNVWHTNAPVVMAKNKSQAHCVFHSVHMEHLMGDNEKITMDGPDTYFHDNESTLLTAVHTNNLTWAEDIIKNPKKNTIVIDGEVIFGLTYRVYEEAMNAAIPGSEMFQLLQRFCHKLDGID